MRSRMATVAATAAALVLLDVSAAQDKPAPLYLLSLDKYPYARCMDGTPGGYYFSPASSRSDADKWVIHLQGGGECTTQTRCDDQLTGVLGSSKYFSSTYNFWFYNYPNATANPYAGWNHVHVNYCTQDFHLGTRTSASNDTWGLHFSGHWVVEAVLTELELSSPNSLANASDVILAGDSAGGIGVWPHVDWLSARYPTAQVIGAPIAGFYFYAYPYQGPYHTSSDLADFREPAWPQHYDLWQPFLDVDCYRALKDTPWACILANYSHPYVQSPVFVAEAQTDQVVTMFHDWLPDPSAIPGDKWQQDQLNYLGDWSHNMTQGLSPLIDSSKAALAAGTPPQFGVFNPACFTHTGFNATAPIIGGQDGRNYYEVFEAFRGAVSGTATTTNISSIVAQDTCGIICNPSCIAPPHV